MERNNKDRPLAYIHAKELPTEELNKISGGSNKLTSRRVKKQTNFYPPTPDEINVVVWD